jgi:hypothetical protein
MSKNIRGASFKSSSFTFRPTAMSDAMSGLVNIGLIGHNSIQYKREPLAMVTHRRPNDTYNIRPSTVTVL